MLMIYATPLSANGRKVLAVCRHLALNPEVQIINVYRGEGQSADYLAVNPSGKIPFLKDGEFTLSESNAILQYLAEEHGGHDLYATSPSARATVASWLFWESAHWQPALSSVLAGFVGHKLSPQHVPAPSESPAWDAQALKPLLERLERTLQSHPFLALDALTLADFAVAAMMTYFRSAEFPFERYPALHDWHSRIESMDAWQATETTLWRMS